MEEEQVTEVISHNEVPINAENADDTQTENSHFQEERQEVEQEQEPAADRILGQKRAFHNVVASEAPTASCT